MEARHLRTFLTVTELLSFNRAAERLHNAQSSISAQIQALETELRVQLFDRLGRRIALREAGQSLIQYAEKIVDLADETHAAISGDSGSLSWCKLKHKLVREFCVALSGTVVPCGDFGAMGNLIT